MTQYSHSKITSFIERQIMKERRAKSIRITQLGNRRCLPVCIVKHGRQRTCPVDKTISAKVGAVIERLVRQYIDSLDQRRRKRILVGRLVYFAIRLIGVLPVRIARGRKRPNILRARHVSPGNDLKVVVWRLCVEDGVEVQRHPLQQRWLVQNVRVGEAVVELEHHGSGGRCDGEDEQNQGEERGSRAQCEEAAGVAPFRSRSDDASLWDAVAAAPLHRRISLGRFQL